MSLSENDRLVQLGVRRSSGQLRQSGIPVEVSEDRELFTKYTNTSGLMYLHIWGGTSGTFFSIVIYSDDLNGGQLEIGPVAAESGDYSRVELTALVPPNAEYEVKSNSQDPGQIVGWVEHVLYYQK